MLRTLFSPATLWYEQGLASLRIIVGLLMAYHGLEVFDRTTMESYTTWDVIKVLPSPLTMVYLGKGIEFVTGVCFTIGFLTRVSSLLMAGNMIFITFIIGSGKFYYQDQHPFLFALLALVFFFTGPVRWSVDQLLFKNNQ